jgi:hypothetical protein
MLFANRIRLITAACCLLAAAAVLGQVAWAAPQVPTRAGKQYLEVRQADGSYKPMYVKGINLSVALPGHHPSEFPYDEPLYRAWLKQIADMHCNVVRVYTMHPPEFYRALRYHNKTYPDQTIWLIQGVWVEPPEAYNYLDQKYMDEIELNLRYAVDMVHGKAIVDPRPGWVEGKYDADVSPWMLAWLIGREWEPNDIEGFHKLRPDFTTYKGKLVSCPQGDPIECWFAQICDYCVAYEQDKWNMQHPVAFSSWPPTDPLSHESESNIEDESDVAGFEAQGRTDVFSNDSVNITAKHLVSEPGFSAGVYASYHIYPYWPDFIDLEAKYKQAKDRFGPSTYYGYLQDLKAFYDDRPLLVAEYGLPNGPLPAHLQSQGWSHGGLSEEQVAEAMPRLSLAIHDSGCAGGVVFAWIDEWFKKTWIWAEMYNPFMDRRLWFNFYDPEENYGMLALHPGANGDNNTLSGNNAEWANAKVLPGAGVPLADGAPTVAGVDIMHDEGFLHVRVRFNNLDDINCLKHGLYLGFDVLGDELGNTCWPGPLNLKSDRGLEEVVTVSNNEARLWQTESFRFWEPYRVPYSSKPRISEVYPFITEAEANRWAWYEPVVETNRRRVGRDGTVYEAQSFALNPLPRGSLVQGREDYNDQAVWNADLASGVIEVRMPYILLGLVGPHQMRVLQAGEDMANSSVVTDGIGVAVVLTDDKGTALSAWPGCDGDTVTTSVSGRYSWPEWTEKDIKYHTRIKPVYRSLQNLFGGDELMPLQQ